MALSASQRWMRVFKQLAEDVAMRYGITEIETYVCCDAASGPLFYCVYRLLPSQLPDTDGWAESPDGTSIHVALENLADALRLRAQTCYFSQN